MSVSQPHQSLLVLPLPDEIDPQWWASLPADQVPRWLAQSASLLYAKQGDGAYLWLQQLLAALGRFDHGLPFSAVHRWQRDWLSIVADVSAQRGGEPERALALQQLHGQALDGAAISQQDWHTRLQATLHELYRQAYGFAEAYATAHANALAYAEANDYAADEAQHFARSYAELNTTANARSHADANAAANAEQLATALISGDHDAYADCYPFSLLYITAHAYANHDRHPDKADALQAIYQRLAYSLLGSLPT